MLLSLSHSRLGKLSLIPIEGRKAAGPRLGRVDMYLASFYLEKVRIQERKGKNYAVSCQDFRLGSGHLFQAEELVPALRVEWVLEGELNILFPNGRPVHIKSGEYMLSDLTNYSIDLNGGHCRRLVLYMMPALLLPLQAGALQADYRVRKAGPALRACLEKLFNNDFVDELQDMFYENVLREMLLLHLAHRAGTAKSSDNSPPLPIQAAEIIRQDLQVHLPISKLSRMTGVNECTFKKEFKKHHNMGPFEFLLRARLENAKKLLRDSGLSIKEIAMETGYQNIPAFCRAFKKAFQAPPGQWREQVKNSGL